MSPLRDQMHSGRVPYVTYVLLFLNAATFLLTYVGMSDDPWGLQRLWHIFGFTPLSYSAGYNDFGVLTYMFLHGSWMHLLGNLLFLYIFGDNIEDEIGPLAFFLLYILCGVTAALVQFVAEPYSNVPVVGASGAIAGLMGAYLMLFPKARVDILILYVIFGRIVSVAAWLLLGIWFALQLLGGLGQIPGFGAVAFWAHAGGFVAGMVLILPILLGKGGIRFWHDTDGRQVHAEIDHGVESSHIPRTGKRR